MSKRCPLCVDSRKDCYANKNGACQLLTSCDFGGKQCPFYNTPSCAPQAAKLLKAQRNGGTYA